MKKRMSFFIVFFILFGTGLFIFTKEEPEKKITIFHQEVIQTFKPKGKLRNNIKPFFGTITNIDGNRLVVMNKDGSIDNILISEITKIEGGKKVNLKKGINISGVGNLNADQSILASNIKINPKSFLNSSSSEVIETTN